MEIGMVGFLNHDIASFALRKGLAGAGIIALFLNFVPARMVSSKSMLKLITVVNRCDSLGRNNLEDLRLAPRSHM